jgi:1-acyl-sn-glycerol-3-phosphate acyltransferase
MNAPGRRRVELPKVSTAHLGWFTKYATFYLKRNFHSFRLLRSGQPSRCDGWPLLICLNHPSWWDPLTSLYLSSRFFAGRQQFAPIAGEALNKYKFFARLGFFGINMHSYSGAKAFLEIGQAALSRPDGALWITPQGQFRDVREKPVVIEHGVGHLAHRLSRFVMLPLALEYAFWNERYPEAFASFGPPLICADGRARSPRAWTQAFSEALENTQEVLSEGVMSRNASAFEPLLTGSVGVGWVYDCWRSFKARLQGKKFDARHGGIEP